MTEHTYKYPRPSLTVDSVVFGFDMEDPRRPLHVLLIRRNEPPYAGCWALPGGFVDVCDDDGQGESLEEAAKRELEEEAGIKLSHLEQLYTFGDPERDPRGRVISVAYFGLVRTSDYNPVADNQEVSDAEWVSTDLVLDKMQLAFDHDKILRMALKRLRAKLRYEPIGFSLLPEEFTMGTLRKLYEGVLGTKLDASNFAKKVLGFSILDEVGVDARRVKMYRFNKAAYDFAVESGDTFQLGPQG